MNKPKITEAKAMQFVPVEVLEKYKVFLIGFRGYYQDTMGKPGVNDRGIYDDCICVSAPKGVFMTFNGNTDPSRFKLGIATLVPGVHLYRKGKHGITTHADGGYWAFRPATKNEALPVTRDGEEGIKEGIAINIHKGGQWTTGSAGCQTIYPDQWLEFQVAVYKLMDEYKQDKIPYVLVDWVQ